jgi:transcriptional regulator with XRE-family HTH domain
MIVVMRDDNNCDCKLLFGLRLKAIRKSQGFSQEALAYKAGLDRTYVSSCERGKRNISLENIYKLATALEIKPYDFFTEND